MANEQTTQTPTQNSPVQIPHNPGVNELATGQVGEPHQAGTGDGVITNDVATDEQDFVASFLDNFDEPSAEELLAEQGILPDAQPEATETPQLVQVQPIQPAVQPPAQQTPQQQSPDPQAVVPQQVPGVVPAAAQPQIPGNVPPVPGQQPQAPQPQAPVQGQPAAQPVAPVGNPIEALRASVEAQREQFIAVAAQSYHNTFTDADVEEMQADPRAAFSKMGARLHFDIVQNTLGMVAAQLPQMVSGMIQSHQVQQSAQDEFYTANPDLKAHQAQVFQIGQVYRQLNPQMERSDFVQGLAALARMQLKLPMPAAPVQPVQNQQQPRPQAFRPAGSTVPMPQGQPGGQLAADDTWGRMDMIFEADERGLLQNGR